MDIRVVDFDGEPWFVAKNVVDALGLKGSSSMHYRKLGSSEVSNVNRIDLGLRPGRPMKLISESGLYKLVMRSDKPQARSFQDWVTKVVLPTIRKTGSYSVKKVGLTVPLSLPLRRADRTGPPLPPCPASAA